jgi:hypothetical protein
VKAECLKIVGEVHDIEAAKQLNDCQIALLSRAIAKARSQQMDEAYKRVYGK